MYEQTVFLELRKQNKQGSGALKALLEGKNPRESLTVRLRRSLPLLILVLSCAVQAAHLLIIVNNLPSWLQTLLMLITLGINDILTLLLKRTHLLMLRSWLQLRVQNGLRRDLANFTIPLRLRVTDLLLFSLVYKKYRRHGLPAWPAWHLPACLAFAMGNS